MAAVKLISLQWNNARYEADMKVDGDGLLDSASGFETAVTISLFTWARNDSADPQNAGQKFGWWGDTFSEDQGDRIGSLLWTLRRERNSPEVRQRLVRLCELALDWMLVDGIASAIDVETERYDLQTIAVKISVTRAAGGQWTGIWEVHLNAL